MAQACDGGKVPRGGTQENLQPDLDQIIARCEEHLRTPETDWNAIYFRIRCSPLGADFPAERFLRTPINVIRWVLRELDNHEYGHANLSALPVARLTTTLIQVAHGFSGSKGPGPKLNIKDFLPFPDWKPESDVQLGPDEQTRRILKELVRKHQIPVHIFTALITPIESQP